MPRHTWGPWLRPRSADGASTSDPVGSRWQSRPLLAATLRALAFSGPIVLSVAVVYASSRAISPPRGSFGLYAVWWLALSLGATVVLALAGRLSRRLLPLASLMRLSLVFPDGAPSRFRIALRSGSVATLQERLAETRRGAATRTPVEEASLLLELVAMLDTHDALTRGHSERVRAYAQSIGREMGLSRAELDLLNWAALLHDVGKLEVPREILAKDGRPTEAEWELIRRHPLDGVELASSLRGWLGDWFGAIEEHHERWDGNGYPHGLAGTEITLAGRIVAVADVYDVITSSRTYEQARSAAAARRELSDCAGTQFDPAVVRAFLAVSVRPRWLLSGPAAVLAHVPVLARAPLPPVAGVVSAAAVALPVTGTDDLRVDPPPSPARAAAAVEAIVPASPGPTRRAAAKRPAPGRGRPSAGPEPQATRSAGPTPRPRTAAPPRAAAASAAEELPPASPGETDARVETGTGGIELPEAPEVPAGTPDAKETLERRVVPEADGVAEEVDDAVTAVASEPDEPPPEADPLRPDASPTPLPPPQPTPKQLPPSR